MSDPARPLIPNTPVSGAAVGGVGAALLAALGWLGSEIVSMERTVTQAMERVTSVSENYNRRITATEEAIQTMRERLAVFERVLLEDRSQRRTDP